MTDRRLLVATHNQGKVKEYEALLRELDIVWIGLGDVGISEDVRETGATFEENAVLKARSFAARSGLLTLADDSGLVVDALDGAPGIFTARYGGKGISHAQRYQLLLSNMMAVPWESRTARFVAVIAVADGNGRLLGSSQGICDGLIAFEPAGSGGFGYDPVFFLPELEMTMAQLEPALKHKISHRGRAVQAIKPLLAEITGAGSHAR